MYLKTTDVNVLVTEAGLFQPKFPLPLSLDCILGWAPPKKFMIGGKTHKPVHFFLNAYQNNTGFNQTWHNMFRCECGDLDMLG